MKDLKNAVGDLPQTTARIVELIQVAAVAVANIEIEMYGECDAELYSKEVLDLVRKERFEQDDMWGIQSGDPFERLMILMEEVGEVAEEVDVVYLEDARLRFQVEDLGRRAKAWLESR